MIRPNVLQYHLVTVLRLDHRWPRTQKGSERGDSTIQARGDGGLTQSGSSAGGEKWLDYEYISQAAGCTEGLGAEGQKGPEHMGRWAGYSLSW